jgi:hypothetical protein
VKPKTAGLWIFLGGAALGLHFWLGHDSDLAEKFYARGIFVGLRWIWDFTLGWSPVPIIYLLAAAAVAGAAVKIVRRLTRPKPARSGTRLGKIGRFGLAAAGWIGALVFFFYILWGFNYNRVGIEKQLGFEAAPLNIAALAAEAEWASRSAAESRALIPGASTAALGSEILPANLEARLRDGLTRVLRKIGYPAPGRVRVRIFVPGGWMMRFSGSGIYIPFFGEGYAAGKVLPFEMPFTMAHEMAHGYGITDEGEANFLALLACRTSADPAVRYSGAMSYWDYAAGELASAAPARFKALWAGVPEGMKADVRAQRANWDRYRGPLEKISRKVYEKYLQTQGIREGLASYSRFVNLAAAWRRRIGNSAKK